MIRGITWNHIQSVWNHSGPFRGPLFRKPVTGQELFLLFLAVPVLIWPPGQKLSNFFVAILVQTMTPRRHFEIIWPLVYSSSMLKIFPLKTDDISHKEIEFCSFISLTTTFLLQVPWQEIVPPILPILKLVTKNGKFTMLWQLPQFLRILQVLIHLADKLYLWMPFCIFSAIFRRNNYLKKRSNNW